MIYDIFHWTEYRYSEAVPLSQHALHMTPSEQPGQTILSSEIEITPQPLSLKEHRDYFGNRVLTFSITEPHTSMHIKVRSRIERSASEVTDRAGDSPPWEEAVAAFRQGEGGEDVQEFLYPSPYIPYIEDLREWAMESFSPGRPLVEAVTDLNGRIFRDFRFDKLATSVSTPLLEVFEKRRGVCQDFAHLEIACLRAIGIPARYVSGYLRTRPPAGQARIFGADASHAWIAFYCPGAGWVEADPTNDGLVREGYVTFSIGRDYGDISLIRGALSGGGSHSLFLSVNVDVEEAAPKAKQPLP